MTDNMTDVFVNHAFPIMAKIREWWATQHDIIYEKCEPLHRILRRRADLTTDSGAPIVLTAQDADQVIDYLRKGGLWINDPIDQRPLLYKPHTRKGNAHEIHHLAHPDPWRCIDLRWMWEKTGICPSTQIDKFKREFGSQPVVYNYWSILCLDNNRKKRDFRLQFPL